MSRFPPPMNHVLEDMQRDDPITDRVVEALTWALSHAIQGRYEMHHRTRWIMAHRLDEEQRAWVLKNALAQVAQSKMNPRANDPNYPLD